MVAKRSSRRASAPKSPTPGSSPPRLDRSDPEAFKRWLADVRAQADDAIHAGLDATAPPGERDLGRRSARRAIVDARGALQALLGAAERSP